MRQWDSIVPMQFREVMVEILQVVRIAATRSCAAENRQFPRLSMPDFEEEIARPMDPIDAPTLTTGGSQSDQTAGRPRGTMFGDYELLGEIAKGGMGVVYKANQVSLNRIVALKMILGGGLASRDDVKRFYVEAEAAAKLDHPCIVPVYEIGECNGQHFFTMGYIDGGNLSDLLRAGPMSPMDATRLMIRIADAIHFAHERGVIHRDLKPSNILIQRPDYAFAQSGSLRQSGTEGLASDQASRTRPGTQQQSTVQSTKGKSTKWKSDSNNPSIAELVPKISDFGLAKHIYQDSNLTSTGQVLGTPSYMPPEQANGNNHEVGPAADIYSLGAILYCMLTGRPPFQSANPMDTLMQVVGQEPISVRMLTPTVPRDLETVCMKCLHKQPAKRYLSARMLAEDLQRFLDGESILARPTTILERLWRWCRKNPVVSTLSIALVASLLMGIFVAASFASRASMEARRSRAAERQSRIDRDQAIQFLAKSNFALANARYQASRPREAIELLEQMPSEYRQQEWSFARREFEGGLKTIRNPSKGSADYAINHQNLEIASLTQDGILRIWNLETEALLQELSFDTPLDGTSNPLAYSKDGSSLFVLNPLKYSIDRYESHPYRATDRSPVSTSPIKAISPNPLKAKVVLGHYDGSISLWDYDSNTIERTWSGHSEACTHICFSPNGAMIASVSEESLRIWDAETFELLKDMRSPSGRITHLSWGADSEQLATCVLDDAVLVWQVADGSIVKRESGFGVALGVALDSHKGIGASSYGDNSIRLWFTDSSDLRTARLGHSDAVFFLEFVESGNRLISAGVDGAIKQWSTLIGGMTPNDWVTIDVEHDVLAIASKGGMVRVLRMSTGEELWDRRIHDADIVAILFTEMTEELITSDVEGNIHVSNIWKGEVNHRLPQQSHPVRTLAFDPVQNQLIHGSISRDASISEIGIWDWATKTIIDRRENDTFSLSSIVPLPVRKSIAASYGDRRIEVWHQSNGAAQSMVGHDNGVVTLAVSPSEEFFVSGDGERAVIWDLNALEPQGLLQGDGSFFDLLVVSPDGSRVVSGDIQGNIKFWDPKSGEEVWGLPPMSGAITALKFSRDGEQLVAVSSQGEVKRFRKSK